MASITYRTVIYGTIPYDFFLSQKTSCKNVWQRTALLWEQLCRSNSVRMEDLGKEEEVTGTAVQEVTSLPTRQLR